MLDLADALAVRNGTYKTDIPNWWFNVDGEVVKNLPRPLIHELSDLPHPDRALIYDKIPHLGAEQDQALHQLARLPVCLHVLLQPCLLPDLQAREARPAAQRRRCDRRGQGRPRALAARTGHLHRRPVRDLQRLARRVRRQVAARGGPALLRQRARQPAGQGPVQGRAAQAGRAAARSAWASRRRTTGCASSCSSGA